MLNSTYPYTLPPLGYDYDAFEPYIDTETMHYHHDKHFQTYINNLNKALEPHPALQKLTLKQLLTGRYPLSPSDKTAILNNGGGVYNHSLFFDGLSPALSGSHSPEGRLLALINSGYGSFEEFKNQFNLQAASVFGSGWTALAIDTQKRLRIVNLKNQDTALQQNLGILILVDVWEHAYYLKYKNLRAEYLEAIWNVLSFPVL